MLTYNGTEIQHVKFNGTGGETGVFNGVTVFAESKENTVVLRTANQNIKLTVSTKKGLDAEVWNAGEKVAVLKNSTETPVTLKDTSQDVIIKGRDIIALYCYNNRLTKLNVQGLTALQWLSCYINQLTADSFKDIFIHLTKTKEGGNAVLYDNGGASNYKDFTQPPALAAAFQAAKAKGWKFYKNYIDNSNLL